MKKVEFKKNDSFSQLYTCSEGGDADGVYVLHSDLEKMKTRQQIKAEIEKAKAEAGKSPHNGERVMWYRGMASALEWVLEEEK